MKNIFICLIGLVIVLLASCDTIEDRDSLGTKLTSDQIKIDAYQTTTGGNQIIVVNNTPGISGQWDLLVKRSIRKQDTVLLPFLGDNTITFTATTAGGLVNTTKTIKITTIDHPLDTTWALLAGTTEVGKTWVWATDNPYTDTQKRIWGNGSASETPGRPGWWGVNEAGDQGSNSPAQEGIDINGKMIFDLNGSANFTKIENGTTSKGSFAFDLTKHKTPLGIGQLTFTGTTIQHGISQNDDKKVVYVFDIVRLTENDMILLYPTDKAPNNTWPEGWFWVFKREGYIYPH